MTRKLRYLLLVVIVLLLASLVAVPFLFGRRTDAERDRLVEIVTPAREALLTSQFELAAAVAAVRGYEISGDSVFIDDFREAVTLDSIASNRLSFLADELHPRVSAAVRDFHAAKAIWLEGARALVEPSPDTALYTAPVGRGHLQRAQRSAARAHAALNDAAAELNDSIEAATRRGRMLVVFFALPALSLAILFGGLMRRVDRLSDRIRVQAEEEAERQRKEREARERLLEREREAHRNAEAALEVRDIVLRIVSHDLKNPLHTIGMAAGMLEMSLSEEQRLKQVAIIRRTVARANRMVMDLLDVARLESGHGLAVETAEVELEPLIADAIEGIRLQTDERKQTLTCEVACPRARLRADRDRLLQVFSNLLGNAVKFTPEGGRIGIEARRGADGMIRFTIWDTGPGVPAAVRPHLFEPFSQAKDSASLGTGLGLSIAKGIVDAHGGRIAIESRPGLGAVFVFEIPDVGGEVVAGV